MSRQLSASHAVNDAIGIQRSGSGPAPTVTSGGQGQSQGMGGDLGCGRPSISTGAVPLPPHTPTNMATSTPAAQSTPQQQYQQQQQQQQQQSAREEQRQGHSPSSARQLTQQARSDEVPTVPVTPPDDWAQSFPAADASARPPPTGANISASLRVPSQPSTPRKQLTMAAGDKSALLGDTSEFADIILQPSAFAAAATPHEDVSSHSFAHAEGTAAPAVSPAATTQPSADHLLRADNQDCTLATAVLTSSQQSQPDSMQAAQRSFPSRDRSVVPPAHQPAGSNSKQEGSLRHWINGQSAPLLQPKL